MFAVPTALCPTDLICLNTPPSEEEACYSAQYSLPYTTSFYAHPDALQLEREVRRFALYPLPRVPPFRVHPDAPPLEEDPTMAHCTDAPGPAIL